MKRPNLNPLQAINYLELALMCAGYLIALKWIGIIAGAIVSLMVHEAIKISQDPQYKALHNRLFKVIAGLKFAQIWLHNLSFSLLLGGFTELPLGFSASTWGWFLAAQLFAIDIYALYMSGRKTQIQADQKAEETAEQKAEETRKAEAEAEAKKAEATIKLAEIELRKEEARAEAVRKKTEIESEYVKLKIQADKEAKEVDLQAIRIKEEAETKRKQAETEAETKRKQAETEAETKRKEAEMKAEKERILAQAEADIKRKEAEAKAERERQQYEAEAKRKEQEARPATITANIPNTGSLAEKIRNAQITLTQQLGRKPTQKEIAELVGTSDRTVRTYMNAA